MSDLPADPAAVPAEPASTLPGTTEPSSTSTDTPDTSKTPSGTPETSPPETGASKPAAPGGDPSALTGSDPAALMADPSADKGLGTETVDDTGQGPNIPVSTEPQAPAAEAKATDSHTFTVTQTLGTSYSSTGVSGTVVRLEADAEARVDSIVITVGNEIAHLFEAGEKWVLSRVKG